MALSEQYYNEISLEDLLLDDYFIHSTKNPDAGSKELWDQFFRQYPARKEIFDKAGAVIKSLEFRQNMPEPGAKERIWQNIAALSQKNGTVVKMDIRRRWMWAAAAVTGIMILSATWIMMNNNAEIKNKTAYGELKKFVLPDQSVVTLNANSSIEYKKEWKPGSPREVWLKGEGFFDVKHLNKEGQPVIESDRFIVHAGDMNVEVLGTTFNVSDRQSVTKVVLETGKVKVGFKDNAKAGLLMEPGDLVKYDQQTKAIVKEKTVPEIQLSWKKKELALDNTTFSDVINLIENNYGYKVEVDNKALLDKQLSATGVISLDDETTLFKALELMLGIDISVKGKTLLIKDKTLLLMKK